MARFAVPIFVCFALFGLVASYIVKQNMQPVVAVLDQPDPPPQPQPDKPKGKLVVLVVFDQMRGDYLTRWAERFGPGGFERIKREGVWYSDVQLPYACASTGPGHASIATGAPPSVTGIIENEWWDRKDAKRVYCCQPTRPFDLVPPPPTDAGKTGRGADTGFSPERLLAETVGDKLKAATGGTGRVFSLSIKDRTAVLMGGQKPDAAYCFDTRDGIFHTGTFYRERVHGWVSEFNATKPADKWFEEKWDRSWPHLDYAAVTGYPDDAPGEATGFNGQGRTFPHVFKGKLERPAKGYYEAVECSPAGNELLAEFVNRAIVAEKLGQGETLDLLCVSFSSNDLIGHIYGPDSWEMFDVTMRSDQLIADFLKFIDTTVGKERYTLVMTADHGVCPLPESKQFPTARRIPVTDVYKSLKESLDDAFKDHPGGPTEWFETNDPKDLDRIWPWIYLNHTAIKARGLEVATVTRRLREVLVELPYIVAAYKRELLEADVVEGEGSSVAYSLYAKVKLAYHPDRCGDVIAIPKPGVLITGYAAGTNHGTPQPYDTHIPVLAIGAGIPALGKQTERKSSLIVAPILAKCLGIDPPAKAVEKPPF